MIVALTGGTGFLGGHVLDQLIAKGHQVRMLTRRLPTTLAQYEVDLLEAKRVADAMHADGLGVAIPLRKPEPEITGLTRIWGQLENKDSLAQLCVGADTVIHVAGVVNADAATFDRGNRLGTENVLAAASAAGIYRFVYISSLSAREPQLSNYGASKRAAEDALLASSLDWAIVRPPAIYGPGDTDNLELFRFAKRGIMPLPPKGRLSAIHADDMARLIVAMAEQAPARAFYEADDGQPGGWSHTEYAKMIGAAVGRKPVTMALPKATLNLGAALDGLFRGPNAKLTRDRVSYMTHPDWVIDLAKRPPAALWKPAIRTPDGLKATADWYRAKGWL